MSRTYCSFSYIVPISINTTGTEFGLGVLSSPLYGGEIKPDEGSVLPLQERINDGPLPEAIITFEKAT